MFAIAHELGSGVKEKLDQAMACLEDGLRL